MNPARLRRLGAYGVDDHGQRRTGPGLDQAGRFAIGDHESHPGGHKVAQLADYRGTGAVVPAEFVADADHHDRLEAWT